jgi:hypothetical protein
VSEKIVDYAGYLELSVPFESVGLANEAVNAFFRDVRELRKKYKLPNIYTILAGLAVGDNGVVGEWITSQHHGDALKCESMTAWALGKEAETRRDDIAKLVINE